MIKNIFIKEDKAKRADYEKLLLVFVFFLLVLRFLFIGDASFLYDEALIIKDALTANENSLWYSWGLVGGRGLHYGPIPPYFYRFLLFFTHNIFIITYLKIAIISILNFMACIKLMRLFPKWKYLVLILVFSSPFFWFYSRTLWDNSINIPITALAFSFYLDFIKNKKFSAFSSAYFLLVLSTHIHLMSVPLCLGIGVHTLIFYHKWILKNRWKIFFLAAVLITLSCPYYHYVLNFKGADLEVKRGLHLISNSFYGAQLFTAQKLHYFFGRSWYTLFGDNSFIQQSLRLVSFLTYPLFLISLYGMYKSVRIALGKKSDSLEYHGSLISIMSLLFFALFSYYSAMEKFPHYHNGIWIIYLFFICIGLDSIKRLKIFFIIHTSAITITLLAVILMLHNHSGLRSLHFGPNLNSWVDVAIGMNKNTDKKTLITIDEGHARSFPNIIETLRKLEPAKSQKALTPAASAARVKYKHIGKKKFAGFGKITLELE